MGKWLRAYGGPETAHATCVGRSEVHRCTLATLRRRTGGDVDWVPLLPLTHPDGVARDARVPDGVCARWAGRGFAMLFPTLHVHAIITTGQHDKRNVAASSNILLICVDNHSIGL